MSEEKNGQVSPWPFVCAVVSICLTALALGNMWQMYANRALDLEHQRTRVMEYQRAIAMAYDGSSELDEYDVKSVIRILEKRRKGEK